MSIFSVLVVGLGHIGMEYDYDADDSVLTHCHAFCKHDGFNLVAGVDSNPRQRERFEYKYKVKAFSDYKAAFVEINFDVVAVSVPTEKLFLIIKGVIQMRPKVIVCEKPMALTVEQAIELKELAVKNGCVLVVNYIRRFDPGVIKIKEVIELGKVGNIYKGVALYSGGIKNNGSHIIDMLRFVIGDVCDVQVVSQRKNNTEYDLNVDAILKFEGLDIYMIAADLDRYWVTDLRLFGEKGDIKYNEGGCDIRLRRVVDDPVYPGFKALGGGIVIENGLNQYQLNVVHSLYMFLLGRIELSSTVDDAIEVLRLLEKLTFPTANIERPYG